MNRSSLFTTVLLLVVAAIQASAQVVVYENFSTPVTDAGTGRALYLDEGTLESGDEVTLAIPGPTTTVTSFTFEYWLDPAQTSSGETVRIRFYDMAGGAPTGSPLYDSLDLSLSQTCVARRTLDNLNVTVPQTFVWTAQFSGGTISAGGVAGLMLYSPATTGSGTYEFWQNNGGVFDTFYWDEHPTSFGAELTAVPEPWATSVVLLSTAAGVVAFLRRRSAARLA